MTGSPISLLEENLCASFAVVPVEPNRWSLVTPLLYADGDGLPVMIVHYDQKWAITDDGMTMSHLFFDDVDLTDSQLVRLKRVITDRGAQIDDGSVIRLEVESTPSVYDIGDFLQLIAEVRGAALATRVERQQQRYATVLRKSLVKHLASPDYDENWKPERAAGGTSNAYNVDLRMGASDRPPIALFLAGTPERASTSALTVSYLNRHEIQSQPVLAYHPDVASISVYRFQEEVGDDSAAIKVQPGNFGVLRPALEARGAPLLA